MNQEENNKTQEFLDKLKEIKNKNDLVVFEKEHRTVIANGTGVMKISFDEIWQKETGKSYFIVATKQVVSQTKSVLSPKACNYVVDEEFLAIRWTISRVKVKKDSPVKIFVNVLGEKKPSGEVIFLKNKLRFETLRNYIGEEKGSKIIKSIGKDKVDGRIKGDITLKAPGYWEVIFADRHSDTESTDVFLSHQGMCLQMQRNVRVVLPGYFLEVADHGRYPVYSQDPDNKEGRKVRGHIQVYPYTALRPATRAEYLELKASGDKITRGDKQERG